MLLPILIHASPNLIHALPILIHWLGFRFSAPNLNTLNRHDSSRQPIRIEHPRLSAANQNQVLRHPSRQPIRIEHPRLSAANQNRVLRHPSGQPIRIEHYVTRDVSARVEVPFRLSARVGSLKPILIHGDLHPPPPPHLICSLFYYCSHLGIEKSSSMELLWKGIPSHFLFGREQTFEESWKGFRKNRSCWKDFPGNQNPSKEPSRNVFLLWSSEDLPKNCLFVTLGLLIVPKLEVSVASSKLNFHALSIICELL